VVRLTSTVVQGTSRKTKGGLTANVVKLIGAGKNAIIMYDICQYIPFTSLESLCSICVMVVDTVLADSSAEMQGYRETVSYSVIKLHVPQQTSFVYRNCDSKLKMTI